MAKNNHLLPDDPLAFAPLRGLRGVAPQAPEWFSKVVDSPVNRQFIEVDGVSIDTLIWGKKGNPGVLLLHGNGGHADWWAFIAPYLAKNYRVATFSFSGSGNSGWRETYSSAMFAKEIMAVAEFANLLESTQKPVFVAHSFSGAFALHAAAEFGDRINAVYLVDSALKLPSGFKAFSRANPNRLYQSVEDALERYRFSPPYICKNAYIADFIGRRSLRYEEREGHKGWCWSFDPSMMEKLDYSVEKATWLFQSQCPIAYIWGENSALFKGEIAEFMFSLHPSEAIKVVIPESDHHVMVDQPLGLISALRALLATQFKGANSC